MWFYLTIAIVLGAVWGAVLFQRWGLLSGCLATVLAGACWGHPFFHTQLGPLPLTADRVLAGCVVLVYLACRWQGGADPKPVRKPEIVLFFFLGVLVSSAITHEVTRDHFAPATRIALLWLMPAAIFWVARQAVLQERHVHLLWTFLTLFGSYLAITALAETRQLWWLVFPKFIGSPAFPEFLGRGRGPFLNPIGNGIYLSVGLSAALLWWPRLHRPGQLLLMGAWGLLGAGAYVTYTRSVWIGAGLSALLMAGVSIPRAWRVPLASGALVLGLGLLGTNFDRFIAFQRDKGLSAEATKDSVKLRPIMAAVAWRMFRDRPLLGCGWGQYQNACAYYLFDRSTELPLERARYYIQHNVFLGLLCETGLLGAVPFCVLLLMWTRDAWGLWRDQRRPLFVRQQGLLALAVLITYAENGLFHDVSVIAMVNMLLFLVAGVTSGLAASTSGALAASAVAPARSVRNPAACANAT